MKKIAKTFYFLILLWINLYLLMDLIASLKTPNFFNSLIAYAPTLLFTFQSAYQYIDKIFEYINISLVYIANPTVDWALEYRYDTKKIPEDFLRQVQNKVIDSFSNVKTNSFSHTNMQLELDNFFKIDFSILDNKTILDNNSRYKVIVKTNATVSYRESLKNIFNSYEKVINVVKNMDGITINPIYILKIKFTDYSPFVKVIPKILNNKQEFDYKIDYDIEGIKFSAYNNTLEIISPVFSEIQNLSKKYIALSNDKIFN